MKPALIQLCHNQGLKNHLPKSVSPLQLQGVTGATITGNQTSLSTKFYIVKNNFGSLLGKQTTIAPDLLRVGRPKVTAAINVPSDNIPPSTQETIDKCNTVFRGTELLKNFELQLHIVTQPLFQSSSQ